MSKVPSRRLRQEILRNFAAFLAQKAKESPERLDYAELLEKMNNRLP
jgi:hypothetical protein